MWHGTCFLIRKEHIKPTTYKIPKSNGVFIPRIHSMERSFSQLLPILQQGLRLWSKEHCGDLHTTR